MRAHYSAHRVPHPPS